MMKKRGFFDDKRGQGLSVNAIILIILGVVVLVALILGFTFGFQGLKDKILPSSNVGDVASACDIARNTQSTYDFCTFSRTFKDAENNQLKGITCYTLANADGLAKYGIQKAPSIDCKSIVNCGEWGYTLNGVITNASVMVNGTDVKTDYCTS